MSMVMLNSGDVKKHIGSASKSALARLIYMQHSTLMNSMLVCLNIPKAGLNNATCSRS